MKKIKILLLLLLLMSCNKYQKNQIVIDGDSSKIFEAVDLVNDNPDTKNQEDFKPFNKKDGSKFKIAVIESGEYYSYGETLYSTINAFNVFEWGDKLELSEGAKESCETLIKELQTKHYSDYFEISLNNFFNFDWNESAVSNRKFRNIIENNDVDLIISLGTTASKIISDYNPRKIPIIADSISDPVGADIIESNEDSGRDFLTVRCDPDIYLRQIKLFYDVVGFKKLGVLYTDTVDGRSYAALDDIKKIAKEKGFEIIHMTDYLIEEEGNPNAAHAYIKALSKLSPKVDAIYLTTQAGLTIENMDNILKVINRYKIPTFAMEGSRFVKYGALLGVSENELESAGIYNIKKIIKIFKGESPRKLDQIFEHVPHITINLKESELIGYDVPVDILTSSDEIYREISSVR